MTTPGRAPANFPRTDHEMDLMDLTLDRESFAEWDAAMRYARWWAALHECRYRVRLGDARAACPWIVEPA